MLLVSSLALHWSKCSWTGVPFLACSGNWVDKWGGGGGGRMASVTPKSFGFVYHSTLHEHWIGCFQRENVRHYSPQGQYGLCSVWLQYLDKVVRQIAPRFKDFRMGSFLGVFGWLHLIFWRICWWPLIWCFWPQVRWTRRVIGFFRGCYRPAPIPCRFITTDCWYCVRAMAGKFKDSPVSVDLENLSLLRLPSLLRVILISRKTVDCCFSSIVNYSFGRKSFSSFNFLRLQMSSLCH